MLCLTRKKGERTRMTTPNGEVIYVIVTACDGKRVRLAFDAPKNVAIARDELPPKTQKPETKNA
jgi:carbon storage regulator CsrA